MSFCPPAARLSARFQEVFQRSLELALGTFVFALDSFPWTPTRERSTFSAEAIGIGVICLTELRGNLRLIAAPIGPVRIAVGEAEQEWLSHIGAAGEAGLPGKRLGSGVQGKPLLVILDLDRERMVSMVSRVHNAIADQIRFIVWGYRLCRQLEEAEGKTHVRDPETR